MKRLGCFMIGLIALGIDVVEHIIDRGSVAISNYKFEKRLQKNLQE